MHALTKSLISLDNVSDRIFMKKYIPTYNDHCAREFFIKNMEKVTSLRDFSTGCIVCTRLGFVINESDRAFNFAIVFVPNEHGEPLRTEESD